VQHYTVLGAAFLITIAACGMSTATIGQRIDGELRNDVEAGIDVRTRGPVHEETPLDLKRGGRGDR
jgi:hypothetical protein